jgi:Caspase recruitment domain
MCELTKCGKLVWTWRGAESDGSMSEANRATLRGNIVKLVQAVDVEDFIDTLEIFGRILTADMRDIIMQATIRSLRMRALLVELPRRGNAAFYALVSALRDNAYEDVAEMLLPRPPPGFVHMPKSVGTFVGKMRAGHVSALLRYDNVLLEQLVRADASKLAAEIADKVIIRAPDMMAMRRLSTSERARKILQLLPQRPDQCFYDFLDLLRLLGYDSTATTLYQTDDDPVLPTVVLVQPSATAPELNKRRREDKYMSRANKRKLGDNYELLASRLDMADLTPEFVTRGIIRPDEAGELMSVAEHERVERFLAMLERRGSGDYHEFMACLYKRGYGEVADAVNADK